jgi:hypothetical protein
VHGPDGLHELPLSFFQAALSAGPWARLRRDPAGPGRWKRGRLAEAEQPLRTLLLEVQRTGRRRLDPANAPAEFGYVRTDAGIGEYPDAEGERSRADVIASLQ